MNALGIDIAHTVSVAASVALGLLGVPDRIQDLELASAETRLLFVGNGRTGWIFSRPFEVIAARLGSAGCPVCAPDDHATPGLWMLDQDKDGPVEDASLLEEVDALDAETLEATDVFDWFNEDEGTAEAAFAGSERDVLPPMLPDDLEVDDLDRDLEAMDTALGGSAMDEWGEEEDRERDRRLESGGVPGATGAEGAFPGSPGLEEGRK